MLRVNWMFLGIVTVAVVFVVAVIMAFQARINRAHEADKLAQAQPTVYHAVSAHLMESGCQAMFTATDGHDYIVYRSDRPGATYYSAGVAMVHAAGCRACKSEAAR